MLERANIEYFIDTFHLCQLFRLLFKFTLNLVHPLDLLLEHAVERGVRLSQL